MTTTSTFYARCPLCDHWWTATEKDHATDLLTHVRTEHPNDTTDWPR